jgi:hypothetical protein
MNEFIRLQEASKLTGKSQRTIRLKLSKLSSKDKKRYIRRGDKNALLIDKQWLVEQYKGKEYKQAEDKSLVSMYERLLKEKDKQIESLKEEHDRQLKLIERQVNITNSYLASKDKNFRKLIENSTKQIESPVKDKQGNWLSRLLNKKIV